MMAGVLTPEARAIAEARASQDRDDLARMVREGKVRRDASVSAGVPGAGRFRAEIEALVRPPVNLAIRPKKRRRR